MAVLVRSPTMRTAERGFAMRDARRQGGGLLLLVCMAAYSGCREQKPPTPLDPPPPVGDEELARLEKQALARADANQRRRCRRPVLRGAATAGPSAAVRLPLVDFAGPFAGCLTLADREDQALTAALLLPPEDGAERAPSVHEQRFRARPLDDPAARIPVVREVERTCTPMRAALRAAVSHEDCCSLFLPGRRTRPQKLADTALMRVVTVLSRALARRGEVEAALQLLVDALRFEQDQSRGGAPWLEAMIASAMIRKHLVPTAEMILDAGRARISARQLEKLSGELQILLQTEPPLAAVLEGDLLEPMLYFILPKLKGPKWVPPGGWPAGVDKDEAAGSTLPKRVTDRLPPAYRNQYPALELLIASELGAAFVNACPRAASLKGCIEGIDRLVRAKVASAKIEGARIKKLAGQLTAAARDARPVEVTREIRQTMIEVGLGTLAPVFSKYARAYAMRTALIAALRLLVELQRAQPSWRRCPAPERLRGAPWKGVMRPALLGDALGLGAAAGGAGLVVIAPRWLSEQRIARPLLELRCTLGR